MSEWKWCQTCQHRYTVHGPEPESYTPGDDPWANGPCRAPDCDCKYADLDMADLW